jgi:hypothetical protein
MESEWILRRLDGGVDSVGSGYGSVAGCCEHGDELSGTDATEYVTYSHSILPQVECTNK